MFDRGTIRESMEVKSSDCHHVGRVDHVREDEIELARLDVATLGKHYMIPLAWVDHVDEHVHLNVTREEAQFWWREREESQH